MSDPDNDQLGDLAWSNDGTRLAFQLHRRLADGSKLHSLWVVDSDGSDDREVVQDAVWTIKLDWANGDSRVAMCDFVVAGGTIYAVDVDAATPALTLIGDGCSPSWSPSDDALVLADRDNQEPDSIRRLDLTTGQVTVLAGSKRQTMTSPDWRPFSDPAPLAPSTASDGEASHAAFVLPAGSRNARSDASSADSVPADEPANQTPSIVSAEDGTPPAPLVEQPQAVSSQAELIDRALDGADGALDDALLRELALALIE